MTQDPIGLAGGVNFYAYAGGNPVSYADPFGLSPCDKRRAMALICAMTDVTGEATDAMERRRGIWPNPDPEVRPVGNAKQVISELETKGWKLDYPPGETPSSGKGADKAASEAARKAVGRAVVTTLKVVGIVGFMLDVADFVTPAVEQQLPQQCAVENCHPSGAPKPKQQSTVGPADQP